MNRAAVDGDGRRRPRRGDRQGRPVQRRPCPRSGPRSRPATARRSARGCTSCAATTTATGLQHAYTGDEWIELPGRQRGAAGHGRCRARPAGTLTTEQLDWLDARAATTDRPVIVHGSPPAVDRRPPRRRPLRARPGEQRRARRRRLPPPGDHRLRRRAHPSPPRPADAPERRSPRSRSAASRTSPGRGRSTGCTRAAVLQVVHRMSSPEALALERALSPPVRRLRSGLHRVRARHAGRPLLRHPVAGVTLLAQAAARAAAVPPFRAMAMARMASELESSGRRVLHLEVGQPATGAPRAGPRGGHRPARRRRAARATPTRPVCRRCAGRSPRTTPTGTASTSTRRASSPSPARRPASRSRSSPRSMPVTASACSSPATRATATPCSRSGSSRWPSRSARTPAGRRRRSCSTPPGRCAASSSPRRRTRPARCCRRPSSSRRSPTGAPARGVQLDRRRDLPRDHLHRPGGDDARRHA